MARNRKHKHQPARRETTSGFSGPAANPDRARWAQELRRSSAAQRHTPQPRKGTRRERERQAVRGQARNQENP